MEDVKSWRSITEYQLEIVLFLLKHTFAHKHIAFQMMPAYFIAYDIWKDQSNNVMQCWS